MTARLDTMTERLFFAINSALEVVLPKLARSPTIKRKKGRQAGWPRPFHTLPALKANGVPPAFRERGRPGSYATLSAMK